MYEQFNKPIQELIKLMKLHYPHDCELIINAHSATIRSTQSHMSFLEREEPISEVDGKREIDPALIKSILNSIYK